MIDSFRIVESDVLQWAKEYESEKFHGMLADPPYGIGFMGKKWDGDIAFRPETWAAFLPLLHDGAICMAFAGTRGYHRMATAIEDAGYIIHPMMVWANGSGFPKSTRIDTQIDKAAGVEQEIVKGGGRSKIGTGAKSNGASLYGQVFVDASNAKTVKNDIALPATDLAKAFAGHRYSLQCLKPSLEPICVFQKPYRGKPVECIVRTGAGSFNIDGSRIGTGKEDARKMERVNSPHSGRFAQGKFGSSGKDGFKGESTAFDTTQGRWPSGLLLDSESAEMMDRQSGQLSTERRDAKLNHGANGNIVYTTHKKGSFTPSYPGSGGASRYFFQSDWDAEEHDPLFYCAKSGRRERDSGLEGFPASYVKTLSGGEREQRQGDGENRNGAVNARNNHPCCKPLKLCKYLASILIPPDIYAPRRILIPFAGVASEMIGAMMAGWEEVVGVELSEEYCEIGRARMKFWEGETKAI